MKTHLVFALMTIALLAFVVSQSKRKTLEFDTIVQIAEEISRKSYQPPPPLSAPLRALNYDQARDIRFKEEKTLWRNEALPFQVRFYLRAGEHSSPTTIFQVNRDAAGQVRFSPDQFNLGPLAKLTSANLAAGDFSGFRIYYPLNKPDVLDEVASFQGASYFRPLAKGLDWGLSARGIAIDTLGKESFPDFTTFWLVQPARNATEMLIYALLEGRDVSGAYEFRIVPGEQTRVHVRAVLFGRKEGRDAASRKPIREVGLAPLTSMFWYGENTSNTFGGWRPEVHDSDGLQIHRGNGEWLWHPLSWSKQRQVNVFADKNLKGFGLFQRDRDFGHYQDLEAKYHNRPSAWVQPDGDWGSGAVVLMQNAVNDEFQDNVVAYWRPESGLPRGEKLDLAYTLVMFKSDPALPPVGACTSTRIDYQNEEYYRLVFLDFEGGQLANLPPDAKVQADIWAGKNGEVTKVDVQKNPNNATWRVSFTVSTKQTNQPIDIGCTLRLDGKPLTETWTYTWVK
jgi:glucans biosynthesis protein